MQSVSVRKFSVVKRVEMCFVSVTWCCCRGVYFVTDQMNVEDMIWNVQKEW